MIRSQTTVKLPVGDAPDWEVDSTDSEPADLKSPAESFIILQSLKQSREKWLRTMFPKFSSRGRGGKQPDVLPPPHTIYNRGRCTLQIGPHFFMDTTVFEVHYRPTPVAVPQQATFVYQSVPTTSSQAGNPSTSSSATAAAPSEVASNALVSSLTSTLTIPPSLISQVNTAAVSNPTLANLLQLAASGRASPDQLKTLALLIQSMASTPSAAMTTPPTTSQVAASGTGTSSPSLPTTTPAPALAPQYQYQYQAPVKEFDIVLEFREAPSDRWIFPRGPATCEWASTSGQGGSIGDITLSTIVPFLSTAPASAPQPEASSLEASAAAEPVPKQVIAFQFKMASSYIWDTFSRWIGSKEKIEENRKILSEIEPLERKFLAYRLHEGSQLTQIQNAAVPSYSMKPIKPATEGGRPKRRAAPRKSTHDGDTPGSPTAKRKRQSQPKAQPPPPKIACFTCSQTDVPLIMGGRYCRPCAEKGKFGEVPPVAGATLSYKLNASTSQPLLQSEGQADSKQTSQPDADPVPEPTPSNPPLEGSETRHVECR